VQKPQGLANDRYATAAFAFCHVAVWLLLVSLIWFVRFYLKAGDCGWSCGLRTLALLPNFLSGQNFNYRQIINLGHVRFLGESVASAEGVPNAWMIVGQLSWHRLHGT
jgi:two-component system, LuxR family, sensor kinase FixL